MEKIVVMSICNMPRNLVRCFPKQVKRFKANNGD